MFRNIRTFVDLTGSIIKNGELPNSFARNTLFKYLRCDSCGVNITKSFHVNSPRMTTEEQKRAMRADEKARKINPPEAVTPIMSDTDIFPTIDLPNRLFDGVPFKDLPIVTVNATKNNTLFILTHNGLTVLGRSCGCDGYKNARKSTNLAAQATGASFGLRALKQGYKTVRVIVKGFGPGRVSSLKGMIVSGMNIVSITDNTVDHTGQRPRKQRRI